MRSHGVRWSLVVGVAILPGCQPISPDFEWSHPTPTFTVTTDRAGETQASACLQDFFCTRDGAVTAETAGQTVPLAFETVIENQGTEAGSYRADLAPVPADQEIAITWSSKTGHLTTSTVTVPAPFQLTGPAPDAIFSRADVDHDIVLAWQPSGSGDPMDLRVDGSCPRSSWSSPWQDAKHLLATDPGTYAIAARSLVPDSAALAAGEHCTVTLALRRHRAGALDPALASGSIEGAQLRLVTIQIAP
jgi:hypothetical protein